MTLNNRFFYMVTEAPGFGPPLVLVNAMPLQVILNGPHWLGLIFVVCFVVGCFLGWFPPLIGLFFVF